MAHFAKSEKLYQSTIRNMARKGYFEIHSRHNEYRDLNIHRNSDIEIMLCLLKIERNNIRENCELTRFIFNANAMEHNQDIFLWREAKQDFYANHPDFARDNVDMRLKSIEQLLAAVTDKISVLADMMSKE